MHTYQLGGSHEFKNLENMLTKKTRHDVQAEMKGC